MVELVSTGKMNKEEFESIKSTIEIHMINNDFFAESKKLEMMTTRLNVIASLSEHIGTLFSQEYVFKEVLGMNDDEIAEMVQQIENPLIKIPDSD
jgi:DNA-binding response OmpR family regulator